MKHDTRFVIHAGLLPPVHTFQMHAINFYGFLNYILQAQNPLFANLSAITELESVINRGPCGSSIAERFSNACLYQLTVVGGGL